LFPGDIVLVNSNANPNTSDLQAGLDAGVTNGFVSVTYAAPKTTSLGYFPAAALKPAQLLRRPSDFVGKWTYRTSSLKITLGNGSLDIDGFAYWAPPLPDAAPNTGQVNGELSLSGGQAEYDDDSPYTDFPCQLKMKRAGSYLFVQDNGHCGGSNVYFTGVYERNGR